MYNQFQKNIPSKRKVIYCGKWNVTLTLSWSLGSIAVFISLFWKDREVLPPWALMLLECCNLEKHLDLPCSLGNVCFLTFSSRFQIMKKILACLMVFWIYDFTPLVFWRGYLTCMDGCFIPGYLQQEYLLGH